MSDKRYGIQELVAVSGIPRRTIRYYVQRGILPAPHGAGRGHYYTAEHVERLARVRELQREGLRLDDIAALLDSPWSLAAAAAPEARLQAAPMRAAPAPQPELEQVVRVEILPGVQMQFSAPAVVPSPSRLRALVAAAQRILDSEGGSHE